MHDFICLADDIQTTNKMCIFLQQIFRIVGTLFAWQVFICIRISNPTGSRFLRSTDDFSNGKRQKLSTAKGYIFFFMQLLIRLECICLTYFFFASLIQLLGILQVMILLQTKESLYFRCKNSIWYQEMLSFSSTNHQRNKSFFSIRWSFRRIKAYHDLQSIPIPFW